MIGEKTSKLTCSNKSVYVLFLIVYILCLPLNAMNIGPFGSALKAIAILPIGITIINGAHYIISKPIKAQFVFTIFAVASLIWTVSLNESIDRIVSYILLFVLLLSGSAFRYSPKDIDRIKIALAWSSRLTAVVMLMFAEIVDGRFRLMGVIKEDPNYLCAYFAFGVIYSLGMVIGTKKVTKKIIGVIELSAYFYLVLISGSRGGLLAIIAGVIAYLLSFGSKRNRHIVKKLVLLIIVVFAIILMLDYLPETLRLRFTIDNVAENGGSGRTLLWEQALDLFCNANVFRQLFGFGTASVQRCFLYFGYFEVNVVHNMFIETLVELGIIGAVIYTIAIFSFIKAAFKFEDKFSFGVIFCMLIMSLSTSIYTFKPYFNIMLFIIIMQNMQSTCNHDAQTNPGKPQQGGI